MVKRKVIAVDVDDVLADNAAGFVRFSNERWGTSLTPAHYDEYWAKMWQVEESVAEERARIFHDSGVVREYAHTEEAFPVLRRLSSAYDLIIVTSRSLSIKRDTLDWIHTHYPGVFTDETIHFAGIWDTAAHGVAVHRTKGELCQSLGVDFLVDDQLKHCKAVVDLDMDAVLFGSYPWNEAANLPNGIVRKVTWSEVGSYFDGLA